VSHIKIFQNIFHAHDLVWGMVMKNPSVAVLKA